MLRNMIASQGKTKQNKEREKMEKVIMEKAINSEIRSEILKDLERAKKEGRFRKVKTDPLRDRKRAMKDRLLRLIIH